MHKVGWFKPHAELFMQELVKGVRPEPSLAGPVNPDNEIKVAAGTRLDGSERNASRVSKLITSML